MIRAAVVALIVGCSGLGVTERGICGNDIVEPGEDCDGAVYCDACAIRCDADATCHGFAGYSCGGDGFCHAPGGELDAAVTRPFAATEARIADIDSDGTADIVGVGTTSIVTLFGDRGATFTRTASVATPPIQGAFGLADLEADGSNDVVIPTAEGIIVYSSRFGSLAAEPFPSDATGDPATSLAMFALPPAGSQPLAAQTRLGVFSSEPEPRDDSDQLAFKVIDVLQGDRPQDEFAMCGAKGRDFDRARFDTYSIVSANRVELVAVAILKPAAPAAEIPCAFSLTYDALTDAYTFTVIPLTIATTIGRPILADLGGDTCPSLVMSEPASGAYTVRTGRFANGTCGFDPLPQQLQGEDARVVGRFRLIPSIPGAAPDALVLETGIFPVSGASLLEPIHRADHPIARVLESDLDRDDELDAILTRQGVSDIDVLLRAPALGTTHGFLPIRMPTAGTPTSLAVGDFDGNGIPDLAFGELLAGSERLLVAYGTPDRLLEPIHAASFREVLSIAPVNVRAGDDPTAVVIDLGVLDRVPGASKENRVTALFGSPSRTLIPVFSPVFPSPERFHAAVVGELAGDPRVDVLVIDHDPGRTATSGRGAMWLLPSEPEGFANDDQAIVSPFAADCLVPDLPCATARYLVHERRVIAFDANGLVTEIDPAAMACMPVDGTDVCEPTTVQSRRTSQREILPRAPLAFDVGGDGTSELVFAFAVPPGRTDTGGVHVCDRDLACTSIAELVADPEVIACSDASPGTISRAGRELAAPPRELFVLCHARDEARLYRLESLTSVSRVAAFAAPVDAHALQIGDITGDAIDDVVLVRTTSEGTAIEIARQRTSREVTP